MKKLWIGILILGIYSPDTAAECFDHSTWDSILKANVGEDGLVDYASVRRNKGGTLYEYLTFTELADLGGCAKDEKKAFYINVYNANVFRVIAENPNLARANEEGGIYSKRFDVANERLSLRKIEEKLKDDPRVHFAIVNGAIGAPDLKPAAYSGETINESLQAAAKKFANDPKNIYIENDQLVMPAFLQWKEADFALVGGLIVFLKGVIESDDIKERLEMAYPQSVRFDYDWTLNDIKNRK